MIPLALAANKIRRVNYCTKAKIGLPCLRKKKHRANKSRLKHQLKALGKISTLWLKGVSSFLGINELLPRYHEEEYRLYQPVADWIRREEERRAAEKREEEERLAAKKREEQERLAAKKREGYALRQQSKLRRAAAKAKIESEGGVWMSPKAHAALRAKKKLEGQYFRSKRKAFEEGPAQSPAVISKHVVLATAPKVHTFSRSYSPYTSALSLWPLWLSQFLYFSFIFSHSFIGFFWIQLYLLSTYKWSFDSFSFLFSKDAYPLFQRVVFFNSRTSAISLYFITNSYSSRYLVNSSQSYYDMDRKTLPKRRLWLVARRPWRRYSPYKFLNYKRFASVSFFKKRVYLLSDYSHRSPLRRPKALFFSSLRAVKISR